MSYLNDRNICALINRMGECCLAFQEAVEPKADAAKAPEPVVPVIEGPFKTLVCFTPKNAQGTVSLTKTPASTGKKTVTTDANLVTIPANAIIDMVEFFGVNNFSTKGTISIGLGQLNDAIMMPLIENTDAAIANERIGGCRQFLSNSPNGKNIKNLVLFQSNINVVLEHPITSGTLQVVIHYHMKPTV